MERTIDEITTNETIQQKIELLLFNHIISVDGIIEDEGEFNVPLEYDNNIRYTFTDTNEYGARSLSEQQKLRFMNDAMDILSDIHLYLHQNDTSNKPMYFIPEDKKIEEQQLMDDGPLVDEPLMDAGAPPDHLHDDIEILNDMEEMSI